MTISSNTPFIIHSYNFFQLKNFDLEKKREKKRQIIKKRQIKKIKKIPSKTTNISSIHLQNQTITIKYYLSLIKSKNHPLRQCEAYDDYQSKYPTFHNHEK